MTAGGIAGMVAQKWFHCLPDEGKHRRAGVVVEIDRIHGAIAACTGRQGDGLPLHPCVILLIRRRLFALLRANKEEIDADDQTGASDGNERNGRVHGQLPS